MNIADRAKKMLLQPRAEWAVIEPEPTDPQTLFTSYVLILAAIPAVASFISTAFIGSFLAGHFGVGFALAAAISQYVLSLIMVVAIAFIADVLAPSFDGQKNFNQALKLTAYAMTASWVLGAFLIIPILGWLISILGSIYSLVVFYMGVPAMMKVPNQKAVGYTVVIIIVAIVIGFIIGMINAAILGMGAVGAVGGMHRF